MENKIDRRRNLEVAIGNLSGLRILGELMRTPSPPQTKYSLRRKTGLKATIDVKKTLRRLVESGWVSELDCVPKKYSPNLSRSEVKDLAAFLRRVGYI
jgi:hypothetical protein